MTNHAHTRTFSTITAIIFTKLQEQHQVDPQISSVHWDIMHIII